MSKEVRENRRAFCCAAAPFGVEAEGKLIKAQAHTDTNKQIISVKTQHREKQPSQAQQRLTIFRAEERVLKQSDFPDLNVGGTEDSHGRAGAGCGNSEVIKDGDATAENMTAICDIDF